MREILLPIDPSTTLKPHSEEWVKKSRSGSTEKKLVEAREGMTILEAA